MYLPMCTYKNATVRREWLDRSVKDGKKLGFRNWNMQISRLFKVVLT